MNNNGYDPKDKDNSSLSNMINDYESDNALRNKIEAIKKQKAQEEEAKKQAEIQKRMEEMEREKREAIKAAQVIETPAPKIHETAEIPPIAGAAPFIKADTDATQVFNANAVQPQDDGDKTLVIMDNMKQRNFNTTISMMDDVQPETNTPQEDRLAPEFEVNDEKISEEDIKEYLPEQKKKKKPMDANKKNKMITYSIAGVASLCVIGLIIFGLNFFGIFGGDGADEFKFDETTVDSKVNMEEIGANNFTIKGSEVEKVTDATLIKLSKAEARSTVDQTKVQVTTVDKTALKAEKGTYKVTFSTKKGTKVTVTATVSETTEKDNKDESDTKDNSAKINELEGQINSNNNQMNALQGEIDSLWLFVNNTGPANISSVNDQYMGPIEQLKANVEVKKQARATAEANLKNDPNNEDLKKAFNSADGEYNTAKSTLESTQQEYENAKGSIQNEINNAKNEIASKETQINDLKTANVNLNDQLKALK